MRTQEEQARYVYSLLSSLLSSGGTLTLTVRRPLPPSREQDIGIDQATTGCCGSSDVSGAALSKLPTASQSSDVRGVALSELSTAAMNLAQLKGVEYVSVVAGQDGGGAEHSAMEQVQQGAVMRQVLPSALSTQHSE